MAIVNTITSASQFVDEFKKSDTYKDNFSYHGLQALYEYLDELSDQIGEDIELDVVAICCDYSEYENLEDFNDSTGYEFKSLDELREHGEVIEYDIKVFNDHYIGIIVSSF